MKSLRALGALILSTGVVAVTALTAVAQSTETEQKQWTSLFGLENTTFSDTGRNTYFRLQPGYRLVLQGMEDGDSVLLIITVLNQTEEIGGVRTRIVEERESANGELVEISRNFFAFCPMYASVFYFGEDVDIYENGAVVSHEGSWRAGQNDFKPGLMMPGLALIGSSYYQEIAPGVAMDRARIVNTDTTIETENGTFDHCLITEETSAREPNAREYKYYAPDIGLVKDGALWLIDSGEFKDK